LLGVWDRLCLDQCNIGGDAAKTLHVKSAMCPVGDSCVAKHTGLVLGLWLLKYWCCVSGVGNADVNRLT